MAHVLFQESPRWLIDHGQEAKGLKVLAQLHANGNESDAWVLAEFEQIKQSLGAEHEVQAKVCGLAKRVFVITNS
jgi:hypothetical protein